MPRRNDPSTDSSALPENELNPLLNPVLGDHMGQWAEVYFTNPPEKREEAVLNLLQELKANGSDTKRNIRSASSDRFSNNRDISDSRVRLEDTLVRCQSCGHDNPAAHRFCGTCGLPLENENTADHSTVTPPRSDPKNSASDSGNNSERQTAESSQHDQPGVGEIRARLDPQRRAFEESIAHPHELSLFRSFRESDSNDDPWDEPAPRRYRFYVGAVLAILIAGLAYMAWRSAQLTSQSAHQTPPAPVANRETPATAEPGAAKADEPKAAPQANKESAPADSSQANSEGAVSSDHEKVTKSNSENVATKNLRVPADNGSEELAVAQRYLNGSNGQRRDTSEAAKWLWKSIAKHNGQATLLLADLYLKGDGVSKNCDQARILLDAAGRKGVPGAETRLRNLQAFSCQ